MKSVDCQRKESPGLKKLSFNWTYMDLENLCPCMLYSKAFVNGLFIASNSKMGKMCSENDLLCAISVLT